ncbi:unnamed protein product [Durusdinium trenchii]|uniref:Uncharacterized protein n=1 Tax=Durusdinium trenchii TaxID=1381693 RepID=A0ABP0HFR1_9DINO
MSNPYHADLVWKQTLEKELGLWCCQQLGVSRDAPLDAVLKEPKREVRSVEVGQQVMIQGSRRRPDLNGLHGEVLGDSNESSKDMAVSGDHAGRLEVRLFQKDGSKGRRMRISGHRLSRSLSMAGAVAAGVEKPVMSS